MSNYDEALQEFGKALGKLKRAYAEEHGGNSNYMHIIIDESDNVTIIPSLSTGWFEGRIEWVNTDES